MEKSKNFPPISEPASLRDSHYSTHGAIWIKVRVSGMSRGSGRGWSVSCHLLLQGAIFNQDRELPML